MTDRKLTPRRAIAALRAINKALNSPASYVPQYAASQLGRVREELPPIIEALEPKKP